MSRRRNSSHSHMVSVKRYQWQLWRQWFRWQGVRKKHRDGVIMYGERSWIVKVLVEALYIHKCIGKDRYDIPSRHSASFVPVYHQHPSPIPPQFYSNPLLGMPLHPISSSQGLSPKIPRYISHSLHGSWCHLGLVLACTISRSVSRISVNPHRNQRSLRCRWWFCTN